MIKLGARMDGYKATRASRVEAGRTQSLSLVAVAVGAAPGAVSVNVAASPTVPPSPFLDASGTATDTPFADATEVFPTS